MYTIIINKVYFIKVFLFHSHVHFCHSLTTIVIHFTRFRTVNFNSGDSSSSISCSVERYSRSLVLSFVMCKFYCTLRIKHLMDCQLCKTDGTNDFIHQSGHCQLIIEAQWVILVLVFVGFLILLVLIESSILICCFIHKQTQKKHYLPALTRKG